jgi:hypothetical protein
MRLAGPKRLSTRNSKYGRAVIEQRRTDPTPEFLEGSNRGEFDDLLIRIGWTKFYLSASDRLSGAGEGDRPAGNRGQRSQRAMAVGQSPGGAPVGFTGARSAAQDSGRRDGVSAFPYARVLRDADRRDVESRGAGR